MQSIIVIRTRGIMIYQTARGTGNTFLSTLRLFQVNNLLLINKHPQRGIQWIYRLEYNNCIIGL